MRLTLRTLLAFLDNILEPEDREALEKKIQESEFAQDLIRRSHETVIDQELSALDPFGYGLRQDPNLVAEYLDNTMPREQIEEFERQCIESGTEADTRLAEVTSCHHILTMVLGDPVQFSASSRDRMYRIAADDGCPSHLNSQTSGQRNTAVDTAPRSDREHASQTDDDAEDVFNPEDLLPGSNVPDYLRDEEQRSRWLPIVATTLVAAVVTGILLILFEPDAESKKGIESAAVAKIDLAADGTEPRNAPATSLNLKKESTIPLAENIAAESAVNRPTVTRASPPNLDIPQVTISEEVNGSADSTKPAGTPPPAQGVVKSSEPKAVPDETITTSAVDSSEVEENSAVNFDDVSSSNEPADLIPRGEPVPEEDAVDEPLSSEKPEEGNQVLGRLVSDDQILLVTPGDFDQLRWVPSQSNLKQGQKLLALPTFRPNLSLLAFTIELDGGSLLELLELDDGGTPTIQLAYGRMVVRTNFDGGTFRLKINNQRTITLTLNNTETAIGVEVIPDTPVGQNPEMANRTHAINFYALSGGVEWQEATQQGVLTAGQLQILDRMPPAEPESYASAPDWLTKVKISNLEKRAVPVVRDVLREDRPVKLSFQELVSKRRQEVKRLALRCCAYIGYFDPLVESLGDENMNRHWDKCATDLFMSLKRHPEYASKVREATERLRSDQSTDLYRMLWGYTNENLLQQGQAQQLVEFLSSEDLDIRVLSHWNLKKITGKRYTFQPADRSESKRRVSVKRYENLLKKEEIKNATE